MVKQEMARVNISILGISELKWMGMGEFNSDDHYIYYCGPESLRNGVALIVNKESKIQYLDSNSKTTECLKNYGQKWVNLIQITIISTTVGKNSIEEME